MSETIYSQCVPTDLVRRAPKIFGLRTTGSLLIIALSASVALSQAEEQVAPLRKLRGSEYGAAQNASGAADRLLADFEARYSDYPGRTKPSSEKVKADAEKVIAAFTAVIDLYPHTEIAAYTATRLAGFYAYIGQKEKDIDLEKKLAAEYSTTKCAPQLNFDVALFYMQSEHDPKTALEWLQKIPEPSEGVVDARHYNENERMNLSVQETIAKCALMMGQRDVAQKVYDKLAIRYPMYRESIQDTQKFENATALNPYVRQADEAIQRSMAELDANTSSSPSVPALDRGTDKIELHTNEEDEAVTWRRFAVPGLGIIVSVMVLLYVLKLRQQKTKGELQ